MEPTHFAGEHLILYTATPESSIVCTEFLRPAGVWPRRFTSVFLTEAILEMVKAGLGVTCMAEWAVKPALESKSLVAVRLGRSGFRRTWRAIPWKEPESSPLVGEFVEHLVQAFKRKKSDGPIRSVDSLCGELAG